MIEPVTGKITNLHFPNKFEFTKNVFVPINTFIFTLILPTVLFK